MNLKIVSMIIAALTLGGFAAALPAPEINKPAPDFTLQGMDTVHKKMQTYKLSEYKNKTVVLEWFNKDCPYVHKLYDSKTMQKLQSSHVTPGSDVVWFTIVSSAAGREGYMKPEEAKKVIAEYGISGTALLFDKGSKVGQLYSAKTTPHMFVIDKGILAYQGAIDDRPSANPQSLNGAQNYVEAALTAIKTHTPIKDASTTPYGCSVKY